MTPTLTKSVDKTWVNIGEIVTYSYDFYNDTENEVWLTVIEDSRIGQIPVYQEVNHHSHKIITREIVMSECRNITNVARAYYVDYQHHILISDWSNEISVFVFCSSLVTLSKSVDKTEVNLGETVTYSYDFYNNCGYPVDLLFVEDNRIGQIEAYETIPSNTHKIITQEVIMNEIGVITNNARAYYGNMIEQTYYTDWSNEISVNVKSPSLPKNLEGKLINTKAQSVNEMGAIAGLITFGTFSKTELASETKLLKEVFA